MLTHKGLSFRVIDGPKAAKTLKATDGLATSDILNVIFLTYVCGVVPKIEVYYLFIEH